MAVPLKGDASPGSALLPMSVGLRDNFSVGIEPAGNDVPGVFPCKYSSWKSVLSSERNCIYSQED